VPEITVADVHELHYIVPIENLPSIRARGVLSHNRSKPLRAATVANPDVQARRRKRVPNGLALHDYVNLYLHARNPMMYVRKDGHLDLAVLRINPSVLTHDGAVITSCNASSDYVRFLGSPEGLASLDRDIVFAD
jgi:hypothetical protein